MLVFFARPDIHKRAGSIEQHRQQQIFNARRIQQPNTVNGCHPSDDAVFAQILRVFVISFLTHGQKRSIGGREQVRNQNHRSRQRHHFLIGTRREQVQNQENLHTDVGCPQRVDGRGIFVFAVEEGGNGAVFGSHIQGFGGKQRPSQQRAQQGNTQTDRDERCTPRTNHMSQNVRHRWVFQTSQFRLLHHTRRQYVHQNQQGQHAQKAQNGCLAHIGTFFGASRINARPFNTNKHPHSYQPHAFYLGHHAAQIRRFCTPEVGGENV